MTPFWEENRILDVRAGSRAHGLATDRSDTDTRGVCVPPREVLLGLEPFEQHESQGGDRVVYAAAKFVRLALQGNPHVLEMLHVEEEDVLFADEWGRRLIASRAMFLSRRVGERFMGYASAQLERMRRHRRWIASPPDGPPDPAAFGAIDKGGRHAFPDRDAEKAYHAAARHWENYRRWRAQRNPERAQLEERHGYDTKHAMHLCRLLVMGGEILSEGAVRVRRPDRDWLLGIRGGSMSYEELLSWAAERMSEMPAFVARSALPEEPDRAGANRLLVEIQGGFLFSDLSRGGGVR